MENEISLFNESPSEQIDFTHDPDAIGCCHRYRECSDAGRCLIPNEAHAAHCAYRNNLEQGTVFYGKRANYNGVTIADYPPIQAAVDALSPEARAVLDAVLVYCFEYTRVTMRCLIRNSPAVQELSDSGLLEIHPYIPDTDRLSLQALLNLAGPEYKEFTKTAKAEMKKLRAEKNQMDEGEYTRRQEELRPFMRNTKEAVLKWFTTDAPERWAEFTNRYRVAWIPQDKEHWLHELWNDTLLETYDTRIYPLSPLAEDDLLTLVDKEAEELRRVKLSPGYTHEEKARRIEEIQRAVIERAAKRGMKKEA